jgi:hypothetical protein
MKKPEWFIVSAFLVVQLPGGVAAASFLSIVAGLVFYERVKN